jgi:GNAT superfamily N-acetyltransferase
VYSAIAVTLYKAPMEIRPARDRDADEVARLLGELGYPQAPDAERLREWEADPSTHALVVDGGDHLAGAIGVQLCRHFARPGRFARIVAMVVDARHRKEGVGRSLVTAADGLAREAGCDRIEVTSGTRRDASHPFYRSLGFEDINDRSVRYVREL